MLQVLKGITVGSIAGLAGGVLGYFVVVFWLISQGVTDSSDMVDIIRSKQAMYWSLPFTFICIVMSVYIASRKLLSNPYLIAFGVIFIVGLCIHSGPLKLISIHMNNIPIVAGALFGAYLASKLNKSRQQDAQTARASA